MYIEITVTSFDKNGNYILRVDTNLPTSDTVRKVLRDTLATLEQTPIMKDDVEIYGKEE